MSETSVEREGSLLKSIREWVPFIGARNGDELEVVYGHLKSPKVATGVCEIRVRSAKNADSITGLMVGETLFTPHVRIQSMRIISRKETGTDI